MSLDLTCLIPAHNEAARIGPVLAAAVGHPLIARVVVIDDGSSDGTGARARAAGAEVITLSPNRGKTAALAAGIAACQSRHILLLDADLIGLGRGDITRLIAPVARGEADVSLSLRGNAPLLWRGIGLDYISGERVLARALIAPHLPGLLQLPRFGFEVFLNDAIRAGGLRPAVVDWPGVASPAKSRKRGYLAGIAADIAMLGDIFATIGLGRILGQIAYLWRAKAPGPARIPAKAALAKLFRAKGRVGR